ncbi:MAG: CBS domain-containing protein [Usitatibacter sp.]
MKIDRIYTRNVVGTSREASVAEAAAMMRKFHVGALLVMGEAPEQETVVGIVTDRDIVMQAVADALDPRKVSVGEVMTPVVAGISEDADVLEALERMRTEGVRRLLVRQANGAIAGILSADDVIDGLATDLASLAKVVRSEIRRETDEYGGVGVPA